MAGNVSEPTVGSQRGTWRSGAASPAFPGASDANRLLRAVGQVPGKRGCTLVRVRLASRDEETLLDVRERLLGEEPIVGTSIGREVGPDTPGTFDIAVVPGSDPATVGRAVAAVDDVVGVAATAFDPDPDAEDVDPDQVDAVRPFVEPEPSVERSTDRSVDDPGPAGLDDGGPVVEPILESVDGSEEDAGTTRDAAPTDDLEVLDGAPDADDHETLPETRNGLEPRTDAPPARSTPETERASTPARTNGGTPDAGGVDDLARRLKALEARVAALETRLAGADGPAGGGMDQSTDEYEVLADQLASLEETIADLERRQRRTREALDESEPPE